MKHFTGESTPGKISQGLRQLFFYRLEDNDDNEWESLWKQQFKLTKISQEIS